LHNDELQKILDDLPDSAPGVLSDGDGVGPWDQCWCGSAGVCGLVENLDSSWEGRRGCVPHDALRYRSLGRPDAAADSLGGSPGGMYKSDGIRGFEDSLKKGVGS